MAYQDQVKSNSPLKSLDSFIRNNVLKSLMNIDDPSPLEMNLLVNASENAVKLDKLKAEGIRCKTKYFCIKKTIYS